MAEEGRNLKTLLEADAAPDRRGLAMRRSVQVAHPAPRTRKLSRFSGFRLKDGKNRHATPEK
jgi:hypothetical protein